MTYVAPSTRLLGNIRDKLKVLDIPIYFKLPTPDVLEPFVVIGTTYSDSSKTAQTGLFIEDVTVQVDIYLSGAESRGEAERVKSVAMRALGHSQRRSASISMDDSIGREVYHIAISMTETVM